MNDTNSNSPKEDEIDLRKLFEAIGNFFVSIWFWLMSLILGFRYLTLKFKILILVAILVGAGWALYNTKSVTPYYQGSIIVKSAYLKDRVMQNLVSDLNGDTDLSLSLSLPDSIINQISGFSFEPLLDEEKKLEIEKLKVWMTASKVNPGYQAIITNTLTERMQSYEIIVNTFEPAIIKDVIEALGRYCTNYEYVKKRLDIDRQLKEKRKAKLIIESAKLDSLKQVVFQNLEARSTDTRQGSNNVILADVEGSNPLNFFDQELKFFNQILAIDRALVLRENFQIFDGSIQMTSPASPSFINNATIGVGYALAIAYILIFLIQINAYLNRVERMQKSE